MIKRLFCVSFIIIIFITSTLGFIFNIVKLFEVDSSNGFMMIVRIIGIFVIPFGAIIGYF